MRQVHSLNSTLPEFQFDDIERRLETDPLTLGGLIDLEVDETSSCNCDSFSCYCNSNTCSCNYNICIEYSGVKSVF